MSAIVEAAAAPQKVGTEDAAPVTGDYYFDSYSHYGIHMDMLKDQQRTCSYRDAILMNPHQFKDKVVMDVGCGTGILSMFAAKAGAKHVIGIDCSSIAAQATQIVKDNGYADVITIVRGKVEEMTELPNGITHVDIIISEWMGYFLLYESMLNTVLYARDRFGAPGVKLLPDRGNMHVCGITDEQYVENKFNVWESVEGFDFSYFKRLAYIEPLVDTVDPCQILTNIAPLFSFDINTVTVAELSFKSKLALTVKLQQGVQYETLHAFSVHFDTPFTAGHEVVVLDTSPRCPSTHWRQTVLYLHQPLVVCDKETVNLELSMVPNKDNPRDLDIQVVIDFKGKKQLSQYTQDYRLR